MGSPVCSVKTFSGYLCSASLDPSRLPVHLSPQPVPRIMVQSAFADTGTPGALEVSQTGGTPLLAATTHVGGGPDAVTVESTPVGFSS